MILFTLEDYLKHTLNITMGVAEETAQYTVDTKEKTHQYVDKIIKDVLSDKREFINFIKKYLENKEFGKLNEGQIETCDKEFITSQFKKRESDIIYKVLDRDIYVLVEHQSKIDYKMPHRIAEYCIELTKVLRRNSKDEYSPVICPIVLYTGYKRWDASLTIKQKETSPRIFPPLEYPTYNLIDINDYTKEELLNENSTISKVLLFEKVKTKEEIEEVLKILSKKELTKEERRCINLILTYSNKINKLLQNETNKYIKEMRGEDSMRFEELFLELLEDKFKKGEEFGEKRGEKLGEKIGEKIGITKAIKRIAKQMLKNNISDEQIIEITQIDKEELEKLKIV